VKRETTTEILKQVDENPGLKLSFIIPTLNEEAYIRSCLEPLQWFRAQGHEVILVDGGSSDDTIEQARPLVDLVIQSPRGRARQMNAGAQAATGDVFLFLHADTVLPGEMGDLPPQRILGTRAWGRYDIQLSGSQFLLRFIEYFMNLRSRITGIATGDQVIFITRPLFMECGGFPDVPIMEDIEFSSRLIRVCRPLCLRTRVISSSRRWEQNGILKTVLKMWLLRLGYFFGTDPEKLARRYG